MPFQYSEYYDRNAPTLGSLIGAQGQIRAQAALNVGQAQADRARAIGGAITDVAQTAAQYQADAPRRQMLALQIQNAQEEARARRQARDEQEQAKHADIAARIGMRVHLEGNTPEALQGAFNDLERAKLITADDVQRMATIANQDPSKIPQLSQSLMALSPTGQAFLEKLQKPRKLGERDPTKDIYDEATGEVVVKGTPKPTPLINRDPTHDLVDPATNTVVMPGTPKVVEPKTYPVTVPGPDGRPVQKLFTAEELAKGVPAYREPKAPPAEKAGLWITRAGPDGTRQTLRVQEKDIQPGDMPASTREQGRPVTSGDAGRITDLQTSLDDIGRLTGALSTAGETGTISKIGASTPNWVTDLTGWGTDAKKKQALIDRVKQVIGKALEGGVLRKEDEIKYEKILPTIGDTTAVVTSKLDGLKVAITQKKERTLESLADAGFDTSRFTARETTSTTVRMRAPNGQEKDVPADQVEHYKALGASVVKR